MSGFPSWVRCAPHGRSWAHYVIGVLLNALLFALIGPAIGGLMMTFGNIVAAPITLAVAYIHFTRAAFIAGGCVAVVASFITTNWKLYAASGAIGALSAMIAAILTLSADFSPSLLIVGIPGAVASAVCTRIARPFRLVPTNSYFARASIPD